MTSEAFVVDAIRTPRGRGTPGGALSGVPPVRLIADLIGALRERFALDPPSIDDVVIGCAAPTLEQGSDVARMAAILAGLPSVSGSVVSRFCASGLDAIAMAAAKVASRNESCVIAGGVESLSRVPMFADRGPWFSDPAIAEATGFVHMAVAADLLATLEGISKEELDALALRSHRRAGRARDEGHFDGSLVPVRDGAMVLLEADELIRTDLDEEALAARPGAFGDLVDEDALRRVRRRYPDVHEILALHQPRSSPGLADGASAVLVTNGEGARRLGREPRARVVSWAHAAVEPTLMLTGNVEATQKALSRAGLAIGDIDLFEVNESFAAVPIHFARALGVDHERLNVDGGAIAMGHPLGATGGILVATALDALERTDGRRAVVSICGGAGVATAMVLER